MKYHSRDFARARMLLNHVMKETDQVKDGKRSHQIQLNVSSVTFYFFSHRNKDSKCKNQTE